MNEANSLWPCAGCGAKAVEVMLDLGLQPPSNMFLASASESFPQHPLRFGVCKLCGLAQLIDPMPKKMLANNLAGLKYNEPEAHLDELCLGLRKLMKDKPVYVGGMSNNDESFLRRLENAGWKNAGIDRTSSAKQPDVLVARRILEHAINLREFVQSCSRIVREGGLLVFEIPGCEYILSQDQHCYLWEEHSVYFTRQTFASFLRNCGLEVLDLLEYELPIENSLVAVARVANSAFHEMQGEDVAAEIEQVSNFTASLPAKASSIKNALEDLRKSFSHIAMFGAGHLGMKYVNFYELASYLDIVIDDNESKKGRFLPLSQLEIADSSWLSAHPESFCLVAINQEKHAALAKNHPFFRNDNRRWQSIFSDIVP